MAHPIDTAHVDEVLGHPALAGVAPRLQALARPAIRLHLGISDEDRIPIGVSKLGGLPDLPPGLTWPVSGPDGPPNGPEAFGGDVIALPFIAQIRMADLVPYDVGGLLPSAGMLWLFFNDVGQGGDRRSGYTGPANCRALFAPGVPTPLARVAPPTALPVDATGRQGQPFLARTLTFSSELMLPEVEGPFVGHASWSRGETVVLDADAWDVYAELDDGWRDNSRERSRLLGYPRPNQAAAVWNAYKGVRPFLFGDLPDWQTLSAHDRASELRPFRSLIQVTDPTRNMWFGREGSLCLFIHERDLAARDFSRVWGAA